MKHIWRRGKSRYGPFRFSGKFRERDKQIFRKTPLRLIDAPLNLTELAQAQVAPLLEDEHVLTRDVWLRRRQLLLWGRGGVRHLSQGRLLFGHCSRYVSINLENERWLLGC